MQVKDQQCGTYHLVPIYDQVEVVDPSPHNNSSHYRDSHLYTVASDPKEQRNQDETLFQLLHLLICTIVSPTDTS